MPETTRSAGSRMDVPAYAELRGHVPAGLQLGSVPATTRSGGRRTSPAPPRSSTRSPVSERGAVFTLDHALDAFDPPMARARKAPRHELLSQPRRVPRRRAARVLPAGHLPGRRPAAPPGVGLRLLQRGGRRRHPGRHARPGRAAVGREAHRRPRDRRRHRGPAGRRGHPARPPRRARSRRRPARPGAPRAGRAGPSRRPGPRPHRVDPLVPRRRRRRCAPRSATGAGPPGSGRAASSRSGCGTTRSRCSPPTPSPSRCFPWCPTARTSTPRRRTPG